MGRRYENPPLIEAVCSFVFEPGPSWDSVVPGLLYSKVRDAFPIRRQTRAFGDVSEPVPGNTEYELKSAERLQLLREDETATLLTGPDSLAVSHRRPYPTWEGFLPLIQYALDAYREVADPKGIQLARLQYINRIDLSEGRVELEEYLDFYPFVGDRLMEEHGAFFVGVQGMFDEGSNVLQVEMSSTASEDVPYMLSFLLDLNYFSQTEDIIFENVIDWLEQAHSRIEDAFEGCLKDPLRQQFREVQD